MPQGFEAGCVSAARLLSPRVRNVAIAAESFAGFAFEPGADVAIRLPGGDGETEERHYSVWKSTAEGTVDCAWCYTGWGRGAGGPRGARWGIR
jgi:ferredoxin-NADP reductase